MSWFLLVAAARACECDVLSGPGLPAAGGAVPADAVLAVEAFIAEDLQLSDTEGQIVPILVTELPPLLVLLAPEAPLAIGEEYTISDVTSGDFWSFTVTDEVDTTAPDSVEVLSVEEERRAFGHAGTCTSTHTVRVHAEAAADVWYAFEASEDADFADAIRAGSISEDLVSGGVCTGDIDGLSNGGRWWWRVRAVDAVGNVSDWSEPMREGHECACAAAPGAGWWSLLVAGALALRRRSYLRDRTTTPSRPRP